MGYLISIPLLILIICFSVDADNTYLDEKCFGSLANYSKVSLNDLVHELQTNATASAFWNASRDEGSRNQVYGLATSRGDLGLSDRMQCLAHVANLIAHSSCHAQGQFFLYEYCSIKVSGSNFLGTIDYDKYKDVGTGVYSRKGRRTSNNISEWITRFMNDTADAAASNRSSYYHNYQAYNPTENVTIYGMSQCGKDLSSYRCRVCLELAISDLCTSCVGGLVVSGSCQVRFETYKFLNN